MLLLKCFDGEETEKRRTERDALAESVLRMGCRLYHSRASRETTGTGIARYSVHKRRNHSVSRVEPWSIRSVKLS